MVLWACTVWQVPAGERVAKSFKRHQRCPHHQYEETNTSTTWYMVNLRRESTIRYEGVMTIQLEECYLEELVRIVSQFVDTDVWKPVIFGSRASGRAREFSDIDLGFIGSEKLPGKVEAQLWAALDDSDIPYVVDIVDMSLASQDFLALAREHMEYLPVA